MEIFETAIILSLLFSGIATDIPVNPRSQLDQPRIQINASPVITPLSVESTPVDSATAPQLEIESFQPALERVQAEEQRILAEAQAAEQARLEAARKAAQQAEVERQAQLQAKAAQESVSSYSKLELESLIRVRCGEVGCDPTQLIRVMYCESGGRPNAKNPNSSATGLFQFMPPTFRANAVRSGVAGANIWDPVAQIHVATWMFANGQAHQWVCK